MLDRLKIGVRLLVALSVMSLLVVVVACSGHLGLRHIADTTMQFLLKDTHLAEEALSARGSALMLRRFEKDYFLNIGAPDVQAEYLVKWNNVHAKFVEQLDGLDRLVGSDEDHATLRSMREDLAIYDNAFEQVRGAMHKGELETPQAANLAIAKYKDSIRKLESTAETLGGASAFRMNQRVELLKSDAARTSGEMLFTSLLSVGVALLLGVRLTRSITVPLQEVTAAARRATSGDFSVPVVVTAKDEFGELQQAMHEMTSRLTGTQSQAERAMRFCPQCGAHLA